MRCYTGKTFNQFPSCASERFITLAHRSASSLSLIMPTGAALAQQTIETIKQHPGPQTAQRKVKVRCPGKFFPNLQPAEQRIDYEVEAVEFAPIP